MESRSATSAFYGRLIPQTADDEQMAATLAALDGPKDGVSPSPTRPRAVRSLRHAVLTESRFYRVLHESKLYSIDFGDLGTTTEVGVETVDEMRRQTAPTFTASDYKVVRIQELTKLSPGRTASARTRQQMMQQDGNVYSVVKMPEEVVASSGRLQCLVGVENTPTWFICLAHVENAFMMLSQKETKKLAHETTIKEPETQFLELLPDTERAIVTKGRFYYRVLVPIEVRKAPDLLAPVISRHVFKNAEEILECHETYRCPQSGVTFVKLAYEDGWLFETLTSGIKVLEKLGTEPDIEYGHFFYIVKIPVGIRVAPHIMAQRSGKGFKLHSIVEASQRFTPPGSKITYVRVCKDRKHCHGSSSSSTVSSNSMASSDSSTGGTRDLPPIFAAPSSCHGGWIFEKTMDGQTVVERMEKPTSRQVERLFYRVLEDVDVVCTPTGGSKLTVLTSTSPSSPPSRRKRLKGTLIECSERLVPSISPVSLENLEKEKDKIPPIGFVKLRHDVGWICERQLEAPFKLLLEQVQGFAVTRDGPTYYRVLVPVYFRSAPDFECPRLPGVAPLVPGTVIESSLEYTPPGSSLTYMKVVSSGGNGWLFDQTPRGEQILEAVEEDPEKKRGKFYFRVVTTKKPVLMAPNATAEVIRYLDTNTIIAAEVEYTIPRTQEKYVRLVDDKGWVALDRTGERSSTFSSIGSFSEKSGTNTGSFPRTLVRISEELFHLYTMPPSWVSLGFPTRMWFKVPDETCRTILADETTLQMSIFQARNILAASSQGKESVPIVRKGKLCLDEGNTSWNVTLEEIKHPASALLFTFPWKQVWWIFTLDDGTQERHAVEVQHGLRGGFRSILFDGEPLLSNRSVTDMLWDSGSEFTFPWKNHTFKVLITLEGAFFSQYLQFYSYTLIVDEENIIPFDEGD